MRYKRARKPESPTPPQKRRLKTKPLVILIGILFACNLLWFIAWLMPSKTSTVKDDEEVASVDGKVITREMWMAAMEEKIGRETLRELVNSEVMEAAAVKYGIEVSEKEIDLELALIYSGDQGAYTGIDTDKEREIIRSTLILEKVLTKDVVIQDEDIKKNYEKNTSLYNIETAYRTSVIVVNTEEEAKQTLKELKDGSNFDALAKERSIDLASANLGGDIGYIHQKTDFIDVAIVDAVLKLKENAVSEPIQLEDGTYAILSVGNQLEGRTFKLKEVKEHIRRELALEQLPEKVNPEAFWKDFKATWFYEK